MLFRSAARSAGQNRFTFDENVSASYSWDSTGQTYGIFELGDPVDLTCAVITPAKLVCTTQDDDNAAISIAEQ